MRKPTRRCDFSAPMGALQSARTKEMTKDGKLWLAVAQNAKKQAFSNLLKGEATEKLMTNWVEACCKEHECRRARVTPLWLENIDTEDIHDEACHVCKKKVTANRYMCGQCLQVEHLKCDQRRRDGTAVLRGR